MTNVHAIQRAPEAQKADFETFWLQYPRKVGKALARAKFNAITNGGLQTKMRCPDSGMFVDVYLEATPEQLVEAARAFRKSLVGPDFKLTVEERFIPHASTWLNKGRFEDFE